MEGSLSKWTNMVQGWQYRWFVLDDNAGLLSYYTVSKTVLLQITTFDLTASDISVAFLQIINDYMQDNPFVDW